MDNIDFQLDFLIENTDFYTDDENKPMFLGFKLKFTIEPKENYQIVADVLLHFNPKKKDFFLCEFTLGKGYDYYPISIDQFSEIDNRHKVNVKEPGKERKYIFLSQWTQSDSEFDKMKIDLYKKWWAENLDKIKTYVIANKQIYNDILLNQINKILIS